MFDLPYGTAFDEDFDISDGSIIPFEHGAISTYLGRRSTPSGHRIVRAGRIVGGLAEDGKGNALLCGAEAKIHLEKLESDKEFFIVLRVTPLYCGEGTPAAFILSLIDVNSSAVSKA